MYWYSEKYEKKRSNDDKHNKNSKLLRIAPSERMTFMCSVYTWHTAFSSYLELDNHIYNLEICLSFSPAEEMAFWVQLTKS